MCIPTHQPQMENKLANENFYFGHLAITGHRKDFGLLLGHYLNLGDWGLTWYELLPLRVSVSLQTCWL